MLFLLYYLYIKNLMCFWDGFTFKKDAQKCQKFKENIFLLESIFIFLDLQKNLNVYSNAKITCIFFLYLT